MKKGNLTKISFEISAWKDYLYWQKYDKKIQKKINELIKETLHSPLEGKGKVEILKGNLGGFISRRITKEHRLVYYVAEDTVVIAQCRYYYG